MIRTHGNSRMDAEQVRCIYNEVLSTKETFAAIGERHNVSALVVLNIANRRSHRHITEDLPDIDTGSRPRGKYRARSTKGGIMSQEIADKMRAMFKQGKSIATVAQNTGMSKHVARNVKIGLTWKTDG